eukprot:TRINITY_DN19269_c0_g1_i1.p1 TRINITY_DN19269_c0_g1~~TRINITY_DN19269_c0_g1_i1.p1  ORF type:complete len:300 (+),score=25.95 TRINITY_DN19269_c0_g1_i1:2-901(+)
MKEADIRPDAVSFGTLILGCCKLRRFQEAREVLLEMQTQGCMLDERAVQAVFAVCKGRETKLLSMIHRHHSLPENEAEPSLWSWTRVPKGGAEKADGGKVDMQLMQGASQEPQTDGASTTANDVAPSSLSLGPLSLSQTSSSVQPSLCLESTSSSPLSLSTPHRTASPPSSVGPSLHQPVAGISMSSEETMAIERSEDADLHHEATDKRLSSPHPLRERNHGLNDPPNITTNDGIRMQSRIEDRQHITDVNCVRVVSATRTHEKIRRGHHTSAFSSKGSSRSATKTHERHGEPFVSCLG